MWIIIVIFGFFLGIFAFSNIIYPLFYAWPRAKQLKREGKLIKPIPIKTFLIGPIVWSTLLLGSIWLLKNYFPEYSRLYYIVLGFTLIVIIVQMLMENPDLEADFEDTWKDYIKEE